MEEPEFSLRDWSVKARVISRENTSSRRFSASYIRSFREDTTRSFRSNITISSTASSPGYGLKEEIDPATYSFTTAIKALQARSAYHSWEALSPDGFALHSKWSDAEKYICNPLSGQVPLECLSAKTLSGRSFRNMTSRITMSAPLVYSSHTRPIHMSKPSCSNTKEEDLAHHFPIQVAEKKNEGMMTKDVGTQSTPDISSSSLSSSSTPPIVERSLDRFRGGDSSPNSNSNSKQKSEEEDEEQEMEVKDAEVEEETKREREERKERKWRQGGCLSWMRKRTREKHKQRKKNVFFSHLKVC